MVWFWALLSRLLLTAGNDGTARLWEVPEVPLPVPDWFLAWAEAVVGRHMEDGVATPLDWPQTQAIVREVKARSGTGFYERITMWYYSDPADRAISPFSEITVPEYVASELAAGTPESLEEAVRVAPDHVEALVALARHLGAAPKEHVAARCRAAYYARRALPKVESALAACEPSPEPGGNRGRRDLLRQNPDLLELVGKQVEAEALREQAKAIPHRDPKVDAQTINPSKH